MQAAHRCAHFDHEAQRMARFQHQQVVAPFSPALASETDSSMVVRTFAQQHLGTQQDRVIVGDDFGGLKQPHGRIEAARGPIS